jgi:putative hydrolase of HD superfamily
MKHAFLISGGKDEKNILDFHWNRRYKMIRKSLVMKLFEGFSIKRWNDQIRPIELVEMDKNAHKMAIAYCLARYEEDQGKSVNWRDIIQGGIFKLLRKITIADIKSPVYDKIKSQEEILKKINKWVYDKLEPLITNNLIRDEFQKYIQDNGYIENKANNILNAANIYASLREFEIIRNSNPNSAEIREIEVMLKDKLKPYKKLKGIQIFDRGGEMSQFIDLIGKLRFQVRWSQTPRIPSTSVLGHSMMVAILTYMVTRELESRACEKRIRNNFYGALFHDLPEALTRDIISPVKGIDSSLKEFISDIEQELIENMIYPILPKKWLPDFMYLIEDIEPTEKGVYSKIRVEGVKETTSSGDINEKYNKDDFDPYDVELIKACDDLAAFVEAFASWETGIRTSHLKVGMSRLREKYQNKKIAGVDFGSLYADF